jgi:fluoroacetyl-CoA thioesterase
VDVRLDRMEGRKLTFSIRAHDGVDQITEGTHERVVIDGARFAARLAEKARTTPR